MSEPVQIIWTADAILDFLHDHADDLRAMGVVKIGLFGSYVRGDQMPESDMDFLLTINDWTWKRWCKVWKFLLIAWIATAVPFVSAVVAFILSGRL